MLMRSGKTYDVTDMGVFRPGMVPCDILTCGQVGFFTAQIKDLADVHIGDTVTDALHPAEQALSGYKEPKPMVYSGLYPVDGSDYPDLRDALDRLQLNDAALVWEPETSVALGFGFRCGFLGLLHMEITRERLEREFDLDLISTSPNVVYRVVKDDGTDFVVTNPSDWPEGKVRTVFEPVVKTTIIAPRVLLRTIPPVAGVGTESLIIRVFWPVLWITMFCPGGIAGGAVAKTGTCATRPQNPPVQIG
jgi:GTP-binding protein LepA